MTNFARFAALLAIAALAIRPALAQDDAGDDNELARIIQVAGEGKATAPPDMATINTGVTTQANTARSALDQNNVAMEKLLALLKEKGVADKDVQTSNFSIQPVYEQDDEGRREPKVTGYRVDNQVRVRVRALDSLGEVLDALVSSGSNRISGIQFGIDDPTGILNQARSRAIRDAKERADVYAQAAGVKVGQVIQIREQSAAPPRPMHYAGAALRAEAASVPIATGEQEYRVSVNVVYALEQ